jgi:hypothetical protein
MTVTLNALRPGETLNDLLARLHDARVNTWTYPALETDRGAVRWPERTAWRLHVVHALVDEVTPGGPRVTWRLVHRAADAAEAERVCATLLNAAVLLDLLEPVPGRLHRLGEGGRYLRGRARLRACGPLCACGPCPHGHVDWDQCPDCRH